MENIKFSVIVPIYNVEKYLNQCIDSVLSQTYKNFELILVDDGSKDSSPLICDDYAKKDKRIVVIHKENGGLVSARKAGAIKATGDYTACVDGDDWIESNYLSDAFEILKQNIDIDLICFDAKKIYHNKTKILKNIMCDGLYDRNRIVNEIYPILIHDARCNYFNANIWGKIIKRDVYVTQQIKIDNRIKIGEDAVLTPLIVTNSKSIYISHKQQYYNYRHVDNGMTSKKAFDWEGPILQHKSLLDNLIINEYDFLEQLYRKTCHDIFTVAVSCFFTREQIDDVVKKFMQMKNNTIYKNSIEFSSYRGIKSNLMKYSLKYERFILIYLYAKMKKDF